MIQTASGHELTLMELLLGFMKFAADNGEKSFPPFECRQWHDFLFLLQLDYSNKFYVLDCIGKFDWDGVHPKCREFSVAMFGLRFQCYSKIAGGRVFLNENAQNDTSPIAIPSLEKYDPELAEKTLLVANDIPGFFEE